MSGKKLNGGVLVIDMLLVESHARGDEEAVEERCQSLLGCADDDCLSQNGERVVRDPTQDGCDGGGNDTTGGAARRSKLRHVVFQIFKVLALVCLLYLFICSLDFLGSAFRLLGGRAAGATLSDSKLLQNPIAGLMIGVLATVLLQSSSTSSSIVVTMVASGIMTVQPAIPIIMGANIGTSLTNTIVSLAQSANRDEFRRAFAGATVHDMFNWLTVIILLPLEMATGYLFHLTDAIVSSFNVNSSMSTGGNHDMLQAITKPFTGLIIQLDKTVIEGFATGHPSFANRSLLKDWCFDTLEATIQNMTSYDDIGGNTSLMSVSANSTELCSGSYLFYYFGLSDLGAGGILLVMSLLLLCGSLILMVKILNSALRGKVLQAVKKTVNAELPGHAAHFTGYVAMVIGAVMTMLVQSSSVFTSVLTPLVGVGVVKIERMYPLTLGSNIGTTTTGILAAMAASSDRLKPALQIAFCHLCFNLSGILLFYPIPSLRFPIRLAKLMGKTTANYRWFAILYVVAMFFAIPLSVFALSWAGNLVLTLVASILIIIIAVILAINVLQRRCPMWLPAKLRSWDFLPLCLHSLEPADLVIQKVVSLKLFSCCCLKFGLESSKLPEKDEDNSVDKCPLSSKMAFTSEMTCKKSNENYADQTEIDGATSLKVTFEFGSCNRILCDDLESGYGSTTATPAPSRLPSYVQLPILDSDSATCTPAPSRKSSFARLPIHPIAEVMTSDDETNDELKR